MSYTHKTLLLIPTLAITILLITPIALANQNGNAAASQSTSPQPPLAGYIGVGLGKLPPPVRAHMPDGVAKTQGLYVAWLADISPAGDDGIKLYDVLLSYDGKPVETPQAFIETVRQDQPGRAVNIKLVRQGEILSLPVTLGSQIKRAEQNPPLINRAQVNYPQQTNPAYSRNPGFKPQPGYQPPYLAPRQRAYTAPNYPGVAAQMSQPQQRPVPLNITGRPAYPMRKKPKKEAWGDERNIWSDFYTDTTGDMWDDMINAPFKMGRMPGGWRAPSWSSPDPVTVGDAVLNQVPPIMEEAGNMADFTD